MISTGTRQRLFAKVQPASRNNGKRMALKRGMDATEPLNKGSRMLIAIKRLKDKGNFLSTANANAISASV